MVKYTTRICLILMAMSVAIPQKLTAATIIANEFWISTNTATANLGTLNDPFDGSTQVKFDAIMDSVPASSTIHILAGTYQTKGFVVQSAEKVLGSGMDATILQFPTGLYVGGSGAFMIYNNGLVTNTEICDLTCDCNILNNSDTYCGVGLNGTQNLARRVKVINCAHFGGNSEAWGISLTSYNTEGMNNIIEECEVSHFNYGGGGLISAMTAGGSGVIRNNRVILNGGSYAFSGSSELLIEGNYVDGAVSGCHGDTGGTTNLTVINNTFLNCRSVCDFGNASRENLTFAFNNILLTNNTPVAVYGFIFNPDNGASYTNVFIFGNNVNDEASSASTENVFVKGYNVTGLTIGNNAVDSRLTNEISNSSNISEYNNTDIFGNYRPDLNIPTIGSTAVSSFGLGLVSSSGGPAVLSSLGLPSTASAIMTNNESQPVTLASNLVVNGNISIPTGKALIYNGINLAYGSTSLQNYFFGGAGNFAVTGGYNTAAGMNALVSETTGSFNNAFGAQALNHNTAGDYNCAFGVNTLYFNTNGTYNVAIGSGGVLQNNTSGGSNTAIGGAALFSNTTGSLNVAYGIYALYSNTIAVYNTAVGAFSEFANTTGNYNTAVGDQALVNDTGGSFNIAVGDNAGYYITNGSYNIDIGSDATASDYGIIRIGATAQSDTYLVGVIHQPTNVIVGGILSVSNSVSTLLNSKLAAVQVSVGTSPYFWTNTTPENVVVYVNGLQGSVGYNGSLLFGPITNAPVTVMLQPSSFLSITNTGGSPVLNWHPF